MNLNATGIADNKVSQIIEARSPQRPCNGALLFVTDIRVDGRGAHFEGRIYKALV